MPELTKLEQGMKEKYTRVENKGRRGLKVKLVIGGPSDIFTQEWYCADQEEADNTRLDFAVALAKIVQAEASEVER